MEYDSLGRYGGNGTSQKVVLFFPDGMFQTEIRVPSLIPVPGFRSRFLVDGTDMCKW